MKTMARKWDLGYLSSGTAISVTLSGCSANVRIMDRANFRLFESGKPYRADEGHYKSSPVIRRVPSGNHWVVVVDSTGPARATVNVLSNT